MNRDDATNLQHLVEEAALRAGVARDDAASLERLVNDAARRAGVPVDEVMGWSVAQLQGYIGDMQAHSDTELRANIRRAIALERIATLTEVEGMPADMTVEEGIGQRILTAEQVEAARAVTEADIDATIAQVAAAQERTAEDIDAVITQREAAQDH